MALAKLDLRDVVVDPDGVLNAGGFVQSYAATTTTPLVTYSDGLGTENTNPVVLDASGQWACYITMGVAYKFVFMTPDEVAFYTADNIVIADPSAATTTGKYPLDGWFNDTTPPRSSELLRPHTFPVAVTFPANFGGSFGRCRTPPTLSFVAPIHRNSTTVADGVLVGAMIIAATTGVVSFSSTAGATVSFGIGDSLEVYGPPTADATANAFDFTLFADLDA